MSETPIKRESDGDRRNGAVSGWCFIRKTSFQLYLYACSDRAGFLRECVRSLRPFDVVAASTPDKPNRQQPAAAAAAVK